MQITRSSRGKWVEHPDEKGNNEATKSLQKRANTDLIVIKGQLEFKMAADTSLKVIIYCTSRFYYPNA